ncbi:MAG: RelA/SpoT domain-containing protein [Nitrospirota bacterium]
MAFSQVPEVSKNQINKAGQILVKENSSQEEIFLARFLADQWRACHAYPINTFQSTLRDKLRDFPDTIVAQRLKRMPTIIDKLKRYPAMKLSTMQDIGGVRAVLKSVSDVNILAKNYRENDRFLHELINEHNYIKTPRDEDGYRSIHLVYKYKNQRNPSYNGLRIELQIRTKLQHIWATAVETMGTFLGQALKSRQGDQEWLDFFALTSSAFAYQEKSPLIPRFANLSRSETYIAVADAEANLRALEKMKGFSSAAKEIVRSGKGWFYHLIILDSLEGTVKIQPYDRDSFDQAMFDYTEIEKEAASGKKIEPVLVSAGPIDTLRRAYPNFFLDIGGFVNVVKEILTTAKQFRKKGLKHI